MYYYLLGSSRFRAKMADAMKVVVWYFAKSLSSLNPIDVHKNYQQPRDKRTRKVSVLKLIYRTFYLYIVLDINNTFVWVKGWKYHDFLYFLSFESWIYKKNVNSRIWSGWVLIPNSKILIIIIIYVAWFFLYIFYQTIWHLP